MRAPLDHHTSLPCQRFSRYNHMSMASKGKERKTIPAKASASGISGPRTAADRQKPLTTTLPLKRTPPEVISSARNAFHNNTHKPVEKKERVNLKGNVKVDSKVNSKTNIKVDSETESLQVDYEDDFEPYESDFEKESDDGGERWPEKAAVPLPEKEVEEFVPEIGEEEEGGGGDEKDEGEDKEVWPTAAPTRETKETRQNRQSATIQPTNKKPSDVIFKTMDFSAALAEQKKQQASDKLRQRAANLLRMVQLDKMEYQLLDIKPMAYDVFIQAYGYMNRRQVGVQTRGDVRSTDIQTEDINERSVWTQHPVDFDLSNINNLESFAKENRGCGTDAEEDVDPEFNLNRPLFPKDIRLAADLMTSLLDLEEQRSRKLNNNSNLFENSLEYQTEIDGAAKVSMIQVEPINRYLFATVATSNIDEVSNLCTVSIWSTVLSRQPAKKLFCYGEITAVAFADPNSALFLAGTKDGTVYLWNYGDNEGTNGWPIYIAAPSVNGKGHWSHVVAVATPQTISNPAQVSLFCTLDLDGLMNVWTVLPRTRNIRTASSANDVEEEQDGGLFPGATVELNLSAKFEIAEAQNCTCHWMGFEENSSCRLNVLTVTVRGEIVGYTFNINSNRKRIKTTKYLQGNGFEKPVAFLRNCSTDLTCFLISTLDGAVSKFKFGWPLPVSTWTVAAVPKPLQLIDHKDRLIALTKTKILMDSSRGHTSSEAFLHDDKDEALLGEFYFKDTSLYLLSHQTARMPMQGLNFKSIKKHPSLVPLYVAVGCGCVGAMLFTIRSATRNPDVSWNKKENPEPWQEYSNKQYKFVTTRDDNTSKAPKFHE